jgi:hypothetical protein
VLDGQTEQVGVCDLSMTDKKIRGYVVVENTDIILPKGMGVLLDNSVKEGQRLLRGYGLRNDFLIGRDSELLTSAVFFDGWQSSNCFAIAVVLSVFGGRAGRIALRK